MASACRVLSARGRAEDAAPSAGRLSPLPAGRWLLAVTRVFGSALPISAGDPSNGADDSFAVKVRRLGRSRWSRLRWRTNRATLDCALPRQTHWHLSGWTGQTRGRAERSGESRIRRRQSQ